MLCDLWEREDDKRRGEWESLDLAAHPPKYVKFWTCNGCGKPVEWTRIAGAMWQFDRNTTDLHKCKYVRPR